MNALKVEYLSLQLPNGEYLCRDLSFTVEPGQVLALIGPSGSGKSSILSWMTGTLDRNLRSTGSIWLGDNRLDEVAVEKRQLGLVLQQDYLFPHMTVGQNLKFGLRSIPGSTLGSTQGSSVESGYGSGDASGNDKQTRKSRDEIVNEQLELAGLSEMFSRDPATLSGGQRARVSLLRTLLSEPCAVLLDEPFSRLDVSLREQIRQFTWETCQQLPVLLVTHDHADIPQNARILDLQQHQKEGTAGA